MRAAVAVFLCLIALFACGFGLDALENGVCKAGSKACGRECVSVSDPQFGCGSSECAPCTFEHGIARCSAQGTCALAACTPHFSDCDLDAGNGCETDLRYDPSSCGRCGKVCPLGLAMLAAACSEEVCAVSKCVANNFDCNRSAADGCESPRPCVEDAGGD